jgi:nucleoid-associated protein YgaU
MPPRGGLQKLKITGYSDPGFNRIASTSPNPINVMINPNRYSQAMAVSSTQQEAAGGSGKAVAFNRDQGESFQVALVFDGTGTVPDAPNKSVDAQLADLRRLIYEINGDIHEPNFVKLAWGTLLFKGRLATFDVEYTLFGPDGTPLRATATVGFIGYHDNTDARAAMKLSSPDLSHSIRVEAGDTLPLLCHRIYGDSRFYLAVAEFNRLDDFRSLEPNTNLLFPPLARSSE